MEAFVCVEEFLPFHVECNVADENYDGSFVFVCGCGGLIAKGVPEQARLDDQRRANMSTKGKIVRSGIPLQ